MISAIAFALLASGTAVSSAVSPGFDTGVSFPLSFYEVKKNL
jgi:hypothetical protein